MYDLVIHARKDEGKERSIKRNLCFYDVLEDVLSDLTRLVSKEA